MVCPKRLGVELHVLLSKRAKEAKEGSLESSSPWGLNSSGKKLLEAEEIEHSPF